MNEKDSLYIKFIDGAFELCKEIPRYFSKYSNRIFCNHQKIVLLVLKQKLKTTYKDLIELLKMSQISQYLGLKRIPNYTTLIKFSKKVNSKIINFLLNIKTAKRVAVDGSGFEPTSKSYYYRTCWNSDRTRKTRKFVKLSIAVDVDKQLILSHKIRMGPRHDTIDFKYLLKDIKMDLVLADRGYDSKQNRLFVFNELNAIPNIPYRKTSGITKIVGRNRTLPFIEEKYPKRNIVETIFSVIKRKYGSVLLSRSFKAQQKELVMKLVAYNIDRKIRTNFLIWFRVSY